MPNAGRLTATRCPRCETIIEFELSQDSDNRYYIKPECPNMQCRFEPGFEIHPPTSVHSFHWCIEMLSDIAPPPPLRKAQERSRDLGRLAEESWDYLRV